MRLTADLQRSRLRLVTAREEEILQLIVAMTARTFNFKICSIMLLDDERQELVIKATQSLSPDYVSKPNLKVGESIAGRAVPVRRRH